MPATHHSIEIHPTTGQKIEKHLCDEHAAEQGLVAFKPIQPAISDLLSNFVKVHGDVQEIGESSEDAQQDADVESDESQADKAAKQVGKVHSQLKRKTRLNDLTCETCNTTFAQFREKTLLGCPNCYTTFEEPLSPMLERAHEGGEQHVGKVPQRAGAGDQRQVLLTRMRVRLNDAIADEDYELAARLRDDIQSIENQLK